MKFKKFMATLLSIMTVTTGVTVLSTSAESHKYTFSLRAGGTGLTSIYDTDSSSYGSVQPTDSGLSDKSFYNVAFCNPSLKNVTKSTGMKLSNAKYHIDYIEEVDRAGLRVMNTASSRTVSGRYDPAGSI